MSHHHGLRGRVANDEFENVHVGSAEQHADFLIESCLNK